MTKVTQKRRFLLGALIALMAASVAMSSAWAQEIPVADTPEQAARRAKLLQQVRAFPFAARSTVWTCRPIARYVCAADGCVSAPALVSVWLNFAAGTYARCDAKGCDTYDIERIEAGRVFSHVTVVPGLLFKVVNDGSAYTEVATAGLVSHVNHGRCGLY